MTATASAKIAFAPVNHSEFTDTRKARKDAERLATRQANVKSYRESEQKNLAKVEAYKTVASAVRGLITTLEADESLSVISLTPLHDALSYVKRYGEDARYSADDDKTRGDRAERELNSEKPVDDDREI
jgi:hypothetical protein